MCGRYYIDEGMAEELEKLLQQIDVSLDWVKKGRDLHPGELAPVITDGPEGLRLELQHWGLPGFSKGRVIFNARSETVLEKKMFQDGIRCRRAVVPARWFYEWNRAKEKVTFFREEAPILYMAGFYNSYEDGPRFVILTAPANVSMKNTHDRMPLILKAEDVLPWMKDDGQLRRYLDKVPPLLSKRAEYEQGTMFRS